MRSFTEVKQNTVEQENNLGTTKYMLNEIQEESSEMDVPTKGQTLIVSWIKQTTHV